MRFLWDTNCCVVLLRQRDAGSLQEKLAASPPRSVSLCSVVVGELVYGAYRSRRVDETLAQVRAFCSQFEILPFDLTAAEEYGRIRALLSEQGTPIGPNALMIAAIALTQGLTLVTHNRAEFSRAPGLAVEDWQT